jgi:hypothetical protein
MRHLVPFLLLLAIGCTPEEQATNAPEEKPEAPSLVGKWDGHIELGAKDKAALTADDLKEAEEQASKYRMTLEVLEDGSYTVSSPTGSSSGTWKVEGSLLVLTDKDATDEPRTGDKQEFSVEDDGNKLVGRDPSGNSDSLMVFARQDVQ